VWGLPNLLSLMARSLRVLPNLFFLMAQSLWVLHNLLLGVMVIKVECP
jgi:hypothetical protein